MRSKLSLFSETIRQPSRESAKWYPLGRVTEEEEKLKTPFLAVPPGILHSRTLYRPGLACFSPNYVAHVTCSWHLACAGQALI